MPMLSSVIRVQTEGMSRKRSRLFETVNQYRPNSIFALEPPGTMTVHAPHFVLYSESTSTSDAAELVCPPSSTRSRAETAKCWHFILRSQDGSTRLDVADVEAEASDERLELLAVVRGLEALDQPSEVTLVTSSSSIRRGLRFGLDVWRDNQWQWERFGRMTPIKNADLWQRVDRALRFHQVDCRMIRFDRPADDLSSPASKFLFHKSTQARSLEPCQRPVEADQRCSNGVPVGAGGPAAFVFQWVRTHFLGRTERARGPGQRCSSRSSKEPGGPAAHGSTVVPGRVAHRPHSVATRARRPMREGQLGSVAPAPQSNLIPRILRRLFGWCGLCRSGATLVITAH